VYAVAGLAGAASLMYEVVWVRQLALSLGSTAIATSTMLTAFLGGLALGGWLGGRRADAIVSPMAALLRIELGAAVLGAVSVPLLAATGRAYVLVVTGMGAAPSAAMLLRAFFSLLVMLVPATLFGAAFPLAAAAAARVEADGRVAGGVYAASSFGSALGAAVGGLLIEPALGLTGAALVAAGINVVAALVAWSGSRGPQGEPAAKAR
jgi:spermidine synthase